MLRVVDGSKMDQFTKYVINAVHPHSPWYEYCPRDEADFREQVMALVINQTANTKGIRIVAVNASLQSAGCSVEINSRSTAHEWVEVYWLLYQRNIIRLGYSKTAPKGMQIFAVPERERSRRLN